MKTFLLLVFLTIVQFKSVSTKAYILPFETILSKTAERAGALIIAIEQNVTFKEGSEEYIIQEKWLIEGDKNLKLSASGVGTLKDLIQVHYIYNNKKRTELIGKNKVVTEIPAEFFERFLAIKSLDSYRTYLKEQGISSKVRLSRAMGAISFAIGNASTEGALSPQIWIDQEVFNLNKIRFATAANVEFSDYKEYGGENNTFHYPTTKVVSWADRKVVVKVTHVSIKSAATLKDFYPERLDLPSEIILANSGPLGQKIDEFYKRFR